ncbi:hypothetical protein BACI9J_90002 [Bacillus altitudinis]|nr:hypothetical protein BACI9J_90002 [Bacillus altitudinis]
MILVRLMKIENDSSDFDGSFALAFYILLLFVLDSSAYFFYPY